MNAIRTMLFAAAFVLAASAHAQDCSGGPDGGMDATGNECSHSNPVATHHATNGVNSAAKTAATSRNVTTASPVARPERAFGREQRPVAAAKPVAAPANGAKSASVVPSVVKVGNTTGAQ